MDEHVCECRDVTPLNYEQFELRFDHYITDERTGKRRTNSSKRCGACIKDL